MVYRLGFFMADNFKISNLDFREVLNVGKLYSDIRALISANPDVVHTYQVGVFIQDLTNVGLNVQDVAPHGNCLFEAVALQLMEANIRNPEGGFYDHIELRRVAVEYIRDHQNDYNANQWVGILNDHDGINNVNDYLNHVGQVGIFAEHFLMHALANAVGVNIDVINLDESISEIISNNPNVIATATVLYTGGHYMSVTAGQAQGIFMPYIPVQEGNAWDMGGVSSSFSASLGMRGSKHDSSDSLATQGTVGLWDEPDSSSSSLQAEADLRDALFPSLGLTGGALASSTSYAKANLEGDLMKALFSNHDAPIIGSGGNAALSSLLLDTTHHTNTEANLADALFMPIGNDTSSTSVGELPTQGAILPNVDNADQQPVLEFCGLSLSDLMKSI